MYLTESDYEEMTAERDYLKGQLDAADASQLPPLPQFEKYVQRYQRDFKRYEELCNELEEYDCGHRKRSA